MWVRGKLWVDLLFEVDGCLTDVGIPGLNHRCLLAQSRPEPTAAHRHTVALVAPFLILIVNIFLALHGFEAIRIWHYYLIRKGGVIGAVN